MFRTLTLCHVILAGLFLPAAVLFALTGGMYTFGNKGTYDTRTVTKALTLPADPSLDALMEAARTLIREEFQAEIPSGEAGLRKVGTSWAFDWSGTRADFSLEPTTNAGEYKIAYKKTSLHRFFVQLHKAKGGWPFKVLAGGLALALLSLFTTGVMLAYINPRLKRVMYISVATGFIIFTLAASLS